MDEIKSKCEELEKVKNQATEQITNANKAIALMETENQELQHKLNSAKLKIVRGDGAPDIQVCREDDASQQAVANLTPLEKKGLHDGLYAAIAQVMQLGQRSEPYQKYVAEQQAQGKTFMPPGQWVTGMMSTVAKHYETPAPSATPAPAQTGSQQHPQT